MSIEKAIEALAASNLALAESNNKLADTYSRYAETINVTLDNAGAAPAAPAGKTDDKPASTGKRGRPSNADKAAAKAAETPAAADDDADDEDPFGDGPADEPRELTLDDIKTLVAKVREKKGDDTAKKLIQKTGAKTLGTIPVDQFQNVVDWAGKVGVTL